MKFRDETRTRIVERVIGGVAHPVTEKYTERVPVMPRDWDALAVRAAAAVVLALTAVAVTWSTVSIGGLLGGGVGYAAAVVFDLSWLVVLLVEWLARFDKDKRRQPRRIGWALVAVAAGAIFWHGWTEGSVALAVIGAAVSVVSKVLWLVVMAFVDREISDADAEWMAAEISAVNAREAIATVRLRAAAAEERAALRLLQAERIRGAAGAVTGPQADADDVSEHAPEVPAVRAVAVPLNSANTDVRMADLPSIAELARRQIAAGAHQDVAVAAILAERPEARPESVAATVRRARRKSEQGEGEQRTGQYL